MSAVQSAPAGGADVALATELLAIDPSGLGGIVLRARPGARRDQVVASVRDLLPHGAPWTRIPSHVTEDRLVGGISLAATLHEGSVVMDRGLLTQCGGGAVILPMAERLQGVVVSHLCASLDGARDPVVGDGAAIAAPSRFAVVALDEGIDDERVPAPLVDRLAFHVELADADRGLPSRVPEPRRIQGARSSVSQVALGDDVVAALCRAAQALGISSLRATVMAALAARAHAALEGRARTEETDAVVAARLVLGPRATCVPAAPSEPEDDPAPEHPADGEVADESPLAASEDAVEPEPSDARSHSAPPLEDLLIQAAKSGIPAGLLDALVGGREPRTSAARRRGRAGATRAGAEGGRPAGVRPGTGSRDERINLVETLRAAAPWQRLRRREAHDAALPLPRVQVRRQDFRVTRYKQPTETSVIFAVDASGSAALQRLAEAKGAVEQVLADCYCRRDHVALIAFRGAAATLLLPPTRSLTRVRRMLADLSGGGSTPLAAGIDAALDLALEARRLGKTPVLVLMTDARANVARDGREGGPEATADALASARDVRAAAIRAIFLDTAPRPRAQARLLAQEMGARYLPLPYLDTVAIARQVRSLAEEST